jgi:hypothetical protein
MLLALSHHSRIGESSSGDGRLGLGYSGHSIRDAGILACQAVPAGALGTFGHLGPCPFGTFAAFTDIGETGRLGGVMLDRRTEAEEIGIVDHTGTCC